MHERVLTIPDAADRINFEAFLGRAVRLDESVVVRLRQRQDGLLTAWVPTGFDALAVRVVAGRVNPRDTSAAADELLRSMSSASGADIDPGFAMDSAWRGALPPEDGFTHVDDVPARVLVELAQRGAALAKAHGGSHGPPASLLDQEVVHVEGGGDRVGVPMRLVFALAAMGFIPVSGDAPMTVDIDLARIAPTESVRVRASGTWLRLDGRYGSVYIRRGGQLPLTVR